MFNSSTGLVPGPAMDVLEAVGRRAWDDLERLVAADVTVEVRADPAIRTTRNEHVWRSVSIRGWEALRGYLQELQEAAPALAVQPQSSRRRGRREVVRAECAGVDSAGSPFDAEADFAVWSEAGVVRRLEASIKGLAVGSEVIRRGAGDPRRYFQAFLEPE